MKSEKNSPLLNLPDNRPYNQYIQNPVQKNIASNNPSFNLEEKNKEQEKDINIQDEQTNFNISFFLPKELRENIEGDEANSEKKRIFKIILIILEFTRKIIFLVSKIIITMLFLMVFKR